MCNHGTLISFQPPIHWFHFNHNDYIQAYNSVITHNTFNFIILKHIGTFVTMVPWFPFNPQYIGFISTMMITYNSITQTSHITHQFHHTEAYRDICNHGTLVSFQPPVHWFHFNQNDYIQVYNSVITHNTSISSNNNHNVLTYFFLTSLLKTVQVIIPNHNK